MDRTTIRNHIKVMKNSSDLLNVLNLVKQEIAKENAEKFYPISYNSFCFYSAPRRTATYYKKFNVPKKSGGTREINAPIKGLKDIQKQINVLLQLAYPINDNVYGFVQGKCIVDNANPHIGKNYIFNIDLKDFFPSINQARVWAKLQLKPLGFTKEVASRIAGLCSMHIQKADGTDKFILPQGAPSSPVLSNLICERLDWKLSGLARRFHLTFTRYADDITFSSMHNVYQEGSDFRKELNCIIKDEGFTINPFKTKLQKRGSHQEVTGLTISNKVNVARTYVREIRSLLYIWERYGYDAACMRFFIHMEKDETYSHYEDVPLEQILRGKIAFLKLVKGSKNHLYLSLYTRLCKLLGIEEIHKKGRSLQKTTSNVICKMNSYDVIEVSKFMGYFDMEDGFKYLTHDFTEGCSVSIAEMQEKCMQLFLSESKKHNIPSSLFQLVGNFITGGDVKSPYWIDFEGIKHKESYKHWISCDRHPIIDFREEINIFKKSIQVRQNLLSVLIENLIKKHPILNIRYDRRMLSRANFYTNVWMVNNTLDKILKTFEDNSKFQEINVELVSARKDNYILYEFRITQMNSFCSKKIVELRSKIDSGGGDFGTIIKQLAGLCHWSIETNWDGDNLRWNILKFKEQNEIDNLEDNPSGFTHILSFYKYLEA